ncbi:MAG TPA: S1 RNA-binding domain-containing protein [archaeon]|nr:S1 RNA-binding domain-containing protein [archaeon]
MIKEGYPNRWELVICKITKIDPHSATAEMIEYKRFGYIHASEVAKRWVINIKEFLKEGQYVVCRVMDVDRVRNTISLSVKRVDRAEGQRKMNEFKREVKGEKFLEQAAKALNKTVDQAEKEIGYIITEEFGTASKMFDFAVKNPELLKKKGIPKAWEDAIIDVAKKNYTEKVHEMRANLKLVSYKPDGVDTIKKALLALPKDIEVKYISAPNYLLISKSTNPKELKLKLAAAADSVAKKVAVGGEASFEVVEN